LTGTDNTLDIQILNILRMAERKNLLEIHPLFKQHHTLPPSSFVVKIAGSKEKESNPPQSM